jgi:hypothetical protein
MAKIIVEFTSKGYFNLHLILLKIFTPFLLFKQKGSNDVPQTEEAGEGGPKEKTPREPSYRCNTTHIPRIQIQFFSIIISPGRLNLYP